MCIRDRESTTSEELVEALKRKFKHPTSDCPQYSFLFEKQTRFDSEMTSEDCISYVEEFEKHRRRFTGTTMPLDPIMKWAFIWGLSPPLRQEIMKAGPNTYEETLQEIAKRIDALKSEEKEIRLRRTKKTATYDNGKLTTFKMRNHQRFKDAKKKNYHSRNQQPFPSSACFKCNKEGHFSRNCPKNKV